MPEHTPAPTPNRAVYGFALQLSVALFFYMYLLWAVVPEKWFNSIGITYLPQRYWAVAIPILLLTVLAVFAFIIYPSLGLLMTPNFDDTRTVTDKASVTSDVHSHVFTRNVGGECICKDKNKCEKPKFDLIDKEDFVKNSIPTIRDLHISLVSEHLYLKK